MATRFCPSPTGYLHIGNVRTALFNYLLAERAGVPFLLRLEDTDRQRCKGEYEEALREDLLWLGLNWQGEPWRQSERSDIYSQYTEQLRAAGHLYPCFCSDEELQVQRKLALAAGRPPRYPGTCRALGEGEVADRLAAGEAHAWRFRVPQGRELEVTDLVRATYSLNVDLIGDFVLVRRDGDPTFLFCNALDDALAGVEMVVRGEDHISNTPKQLLLFEALGMRPPAYGHLAVLTGADNKPLSKRDGSSAVRLLREEGYLPSALLNQVVRLGHKVTDKALLDFRAMAAQTDLGSMSRSPSIWQRDGLKHWQKLAVEAMTDADLAAWIAPHLPQLPEGVEHHRWRTCCVRTCCLPLRQSSGCGRSLATTCTGRTATGKRWGKLAAGFLPRRWRAGRSSTAIGRVLSPLSASAAARRGASFSCHSGWRSVARGTAPSWTRWRR